MWQVLVVASSSSQGPHGVALHFRIVPCLSFPLGCSWGVASNGWHSLGSAHACFCPPFLLIVTGCHHLFFLQVSCFLPLPVYPATASRLELFHWGIIDIQHCISFRRTTKWCNIWLYCERATIISLGNIHHHSYRIFFLMVRTFKTYS